MPKPNKRQLLDASSVDLYERLKRAFREGEADDDERADGFISAESVIDAYLDAVAANSTALPASTELALACAYVLVATKTLTQDDMDVILLLNAPMLGVSLFSVAPQVMDMKRRALVALELMASDPSTRNPDHDPIF